MLILLTRTLEVSLEELEALPSCEPLRAAAAAEEETLRRQMNDEFAKTNLKIAENSEIIV